MSKSLRDLSKDRWPGPCVIVLLGGIFFGGCETTPPCSSTQTVPAQVSQPGSAASSSSAALEHKVKTQEKRIAELSMQLKLLKHIDLDESKR